MEWVTKETIPVVVHVTKDITCLILIGFIVNHVHLVNTQIIAVLVNAMYVNIHLVQLVMVVIHVQLYN